MSGKKYTQKEIEYLKSHYSNTRTIDIAKYLNKTIKSVYYKANQLDLKKSLVIIKLEAKLSAIKNRDRISKSWYKKGDISHNKGKKQIDYMSIESIEKTKATQFKKGNLPHNTKHDGALSIRPDIKTNINYIYIRIALGKWKLYNRYLYEKYHNLTLTSKDVIIFIDGNQSNFRKENLKKVSRAELIEINSIRTKPLEYRELHSAMLKLKNKIKKLEKNGK